MQQRNNTPAARTKRVPVGILCIFFASSARDVLKAKPFSDLPAYVVQFSGVAALEISMSGLRGRTARSDRIALRFRPDVEEGASVSSATEIQERTTCRTLEEDGLDQVGSRAYRDDVEAGVVIGEVSRNALQPYFQDRF